jgi:integrase/recombinase XerD
MSATRTLTPSQRLTELTLDFLGYLELERRLSRNTLEAYRSDLQQFGAFLDAHQRDPITVSPPDLAQYVTELATGAGRRRSSAKSPACGRSTATCGASS